MAPDSNPVVSIIVPARNEEANLAGCLKSLVTQTGIRFGIIVVDDDSTDRTAEIARSFATRKPETRGPSDHARDEHERDDHTREGTASAVPQDSPSDDRGFSPAVRVIPAGPLPENWTGKNNAMSAGAKAANTNTNTKAKWLLFTDADTVHQLATTYPPQAVNDPASPIAAANGQYLMISREAYDAVGGHTTISADLLEDVALARLIKRAGRKIFFRYAPDAVRTRMYRSFAQLREGWTKNLALLFPRPRGLAVLRMAEFALIAGNLVTAIWAKFSGRPNLALQTALLTIILSGWFAMRIRKAHFSTFSNLLAILGLPMFSYLLLQSASLHRNTGVAWKGREYASHQSMYF